MTPADLDSLLTLREIAARYGFSYARAYNQAPNFGPAVTVGRTQLYHATAVEKALKSYRPRIRTGVKVA